MALQIKQNKKDLEILFTGYIGEDITVEDVQNLTSQIEQSENVLLQINSGGGLIMDGWAMYNILKPFASKIDVEIIGLAASMASVIALVGKKLIMRSGSWLMIHNPTTGLIGESKDMRHTAEILDLMKDDILNLYCSKSNLSKDELKNMMDVETWMNAESALEFGFANEVDENVLASVASIKLPTFKNLPTEINLPKNLEKNELEKLETENKLENLEIENELEKLEIISEKKEDIKINEQIKKEVKSMEFNRDEFKAEIMADVMAKLPSGRELSVNEKSENKNDGWFVNYVASKGKIEPAKNATVKTADGYGTPTAVDSEVYKRRAIGSLMRKPIDNVADARVKKVASDIKTTVKVSPSAQIIAEGANYVDGSDKGTVITSDVIKMGSIYSVSEELAEDSVIDFVADFSDDAGRALAQLENQYFFIGSGVDQPQGIMTGGTVAVTTASNSAVTYDELVQLDEALPEEYQTGAVYFMDATTVALIRKLKDTASKPILQEYADGRVMTLFGRPIVRVSAIDKVGVAKKVICLGNRSAYGIFDRTSGMKVRVTENSQNGSTEIRWSLRTDGRVLDATGFQVLQMKLV